MADKLTQQITDALTRVAAEPGGLPLYAGKGEAGLFPNAAVAKPAAQKCLADRLVRVVATDTQVKTPRDLYGLTDDGWAFLLAAVNPKQVLEDFVRVLESRQGEVDELLAAARRMADGLHGLKDAVARALREAPTPPAPLSSGRGEQEKNLPPQPSSRGGKGAGGIGSFAPALRAHLANRSGPTDCPLPELFRAVASAEALTIGAFHDCLRQLHADGAVSLPAWTGPLYALPEPQYALLIGHGIAYYASLK